MAPPVRPIPSYRRAGPGYPGSLRRAPARIARRDAPRRAIQRRGPGGGAPRASLKIVAMSASVKTLGRVGSGSASATAADGRTRRSRCRTADGHARMRSSARA